MSEIRVTNVIGENGDSPVNFTKGINMSGICTAPAFIPSQGQLSHRNIVINGAMTVAQRGVSSSAGNGYHTVDRIKFRSGGNDEANTVSRIVLNSTDTGPYEKGFRYAYRMQNGNQTSVGTGDWAQIEYHPEAQDIANSGWDYTNPNSFITLSFWTRSSVGQRFYGYMDSIDGTGQRYSFATDGGSALSANTWRFVSVTIPGNSNLQFDNNSDNGLDIKFVTYYGTSYTDNSYTMNNWAATGSNYMHDFPSTWYTTNDATWDITGIQLEVGSVATPFEHRSYADELKRCQRYYYKSSRWMGGARGSSTARSFTTDFGMRLTGSDVSSGTYTNDGTASGDVVYIGSNATRQVSNVTANSMGASSSSTEGSMQIGVTVGYGIGSGDNGIVTGLYLGGFTIDHEI